MASSLAPRSRSLVLAVSLIALLNCSSKPVVIASANCFPVTHSSGRDNLYATESADVTVTSTVSLANASVRVHMLDTAGADLGSFTAKVAGVKANEPKTLRMTRVGPTRAAVGGGIPPGGWELVVDCLAAVTSYVEA